MKRAPYDLNAPQIRIAYARNHIAWFLKNHPDAVEDFLRDVETRSAQKLEDAERRELATLREQAFRAEKGRDISCNSLFELIY